MDVNLHPNFPSIMEESFNITKSERLSLVMGDRGTSRIKKFEEQTGARIRINYDQTDDAILKIYGYSSQREEVKSLIRHTIEKTSFIPMISYLILTESVSNRKLKFVKYDGSIRRNCYYVEFSHTLEEIDDINEITNIFEDIQITTTFSQFNTFDNIEDCLDQLSSKLKLNFKQNSENSLFPEKIILKPRIFFGKVLFSEINHPEEPFTLKEWYRLNRRSRYGTENTDNDKSVNIEFQQYSSQLYDNFKILKQQFGFKLDSKRVIEGIHKGAIYIYYNPLTNRKRKLKLQWDERENRWKITNHSYSLNRVANMDIISGTIAPDFRFSLKTHYDLPPKDSKVEEVINRIQFAQDFAERDGMYFRSKDFAGTLIKQAVVRQVIEKKRFRNKNFLITFTTIKHDEGINDEIIIQKLITLKHRSWSKEIGLNDERFMINVNDTLYYVKDVMDALV